MNYNEIFLEGYYDALEEYGYFNEKYVTDANIINNVVQDHAKSVKSGAKASGAIWGTVGAYNIARGATRIKKIKELKKKLANAKTDTEKILLKNEIKRLKRGIIRNGIGSAASVAGTAGAIRAHRYGTKISKNSRKISNRLAENGKLLNKKLGLD